TDHVVVYDGAGIFSAPRVWWALRRMGHGKVQVLDGGLPKWKAESRPLESGAASPRPASFRARPIEALARDYESMLAHVRAHDVQILDARSATRFSGV